MKITHYSYSCPAPGVPLRPLPAICSPIPVPPSTLAPTTTIPLLSDDVLPGGSGEGSGDEAGGSGDVFLPVDTNTILPTMPSTGPQPTPGKND